MQQCEGGKWADILNAAHKLRSWNIPVDLVVFNTNNNLDKERNFTMFSSEKINFQELM